MGHNTCSNAIDLYPRFVETTNTREVTMNKNCVAPYGVIPRLIQDNSSIPFSNLSVCRLEQKHNMME